MEAYTNIVYIINTGELASKGIETMSEQIRKIKKQTKITLAKQFHFFQKTNKKTPL